MQARDGDGDGGSTDAVPHGYEHASEEPITSDHVDAMVDAAITTGNWASVRAVVALGEDIRRYVRQEKGRELRVACEAAVADGAWESVRDLAALDIDLVASIVGARLKDACTLTPVDGAQVVANVQALVANDVVHDLLHDNKRIASPAFKAAIDRGHVRVVRALVKGGADLSTHLPYRRFFSESLLRYAVEQNDLRMVECLLDMWTAPVDEGVADDKHHYTDVLGPAIQKKNREILKLLVDADARRGWAEAAVDLDDIDVIQFLIEQGLDPTYVNTDGESVLHVAIRKGKTDLAERLLADGHDPHAVDLKGRTLMHVVQDIDAFHLLRANGVPVSEIDEDGRTPLHACCRRHDFVSAPTVSMGNSRPAVNVDVDVLRALLEHGAAGDVNKRDTSGWQPLHYLLQDIAVDRQVGNEQRADPVALLLDAGADAVGTSNNKIRSPLRVLLGRHPKFVRPGYLTLLRVLFSRGATWDAGCDDDLERIGQERHELCEQHGQEVEDVDGTVVELDRSGELIELQHQTYQYEKVRACFRQWADDKKHGNELMEIPFEIFDVGDEAIKAYVQDMKSSDQGDKTWRHKICVVGPSGWGKTSLVKSILASASRLAPEEDRTVGVDIHEYTFVEERRDVEPMPEPSPHMNTYKYHKVSFWDFAGQDEYRATHSLFFTEGTLYVVCVDLEQYWDHLKERDDVTREQRNQTLRRFVDKHVLRWMEQIALSQNGAQFFVVGTKLDALLAKGTTSNWKEIWDDLEGRLTNDLKGRLVKPTPAWMGAVVPELTTTSSTDHLSVERVRASLESILMKSNQSFPMTTGLTAALEYVKERRQRADNATDELVAETREVCADLKKRCPGADPKNYLLPVLQKLGEILWLEGVQSGALQNHIIFDPRLVIDLVKEVVNHIRTAPTQGDSAQRLQEEGFLADKDLVQGKLWGQLSQDRKLAFKMWLLDLDVAYPANDDGMKANSDLIVPAYWSTQHRETPLLAQATSSLTSPAAFTVAWSYEIPATLSENVLKKFAVRSYHPHLARKVSWSREAATIRIVINAETEVQITLRVQETESGDVIRIHVGASHEAQAIALLKYFVVKMEHVLAKELKNHSHVERRFMRADGGEDLVGNIQRVLGGPFGARSSTWPRTQDDFAWFDDWRQPATLALINKQLAAIQTQIARGELGKRFPGRWTVTLKAETLELQVLSDDAPHDCYHTPIEISVPSWHKHGARMKDVVDGGKSILTELLPELLVELAAKKLWTKAQEGEAAHAIITALRLSEGRTFHSIDSSFSEAENENSLCTLLTLARKDCEIDGQIQRVCQLERKLRDGCFVWVEDPSRLNATTLDLTLEIVGGGTKEYKIEWALLDPTLPEPIYSGASETATMRNVSVGQLRACSLRVVVKRQIVFVRCLRFGLRSHEATVALNDKVAKDAQANALDIEGVLTPNKVAYHVRFRLKSSM